MHSEPAGYVSDYLEQATEYILRTNPNVTSAAILSFGPNGDPRRPHHVDSGNRGDHSA
jgi:hypothetical protein